MVSFSEVYAEGDSISIRIRDVDSRGLYVLVDKYWAERIIKDIAWENGTFSIFDDGINSYYKIWIDNPSIMKTIRFEKFSLTQDKALYSVGSNETVKLQRPMWISLKELPYDKTNIKSRSNANGSWIINETKRIQRLAIEFNDTDHSGQEVRYNMSWLKRLGFQNPRFQHENGIAIPSNVSNGFYIVCPRHFSIIYTFDDSNEGFSPYSSYYGQSIVKWDSSRKAIYWESDRTDEYDTILDKTISLVSISSEWWRISASLKIDEPGHYVPVFPLVFCSFYFGGNDIYSTSPCIWFRWIYFGDQAPTNRLYMGYTSRDGVLRINELAVLGSVSTSYVMQVEYVNSPLTPKKLTMRVLDLSNQIIKEKSYSISGEDDGFDFLSHIGVASDGKSQSWEPRAKGITDNIIIEGALATNKVINPSFEKDSNYDLIPDNWRHTYSGGGSTFREALSIRRSGIAAIKMFDTSSTYSEGISTDYYSITSGNYYTASAWIYLVSSFPSYSFDIYLEFYNSGYQRIGLYRLTSTAANVITTGQWFELRVTAIAPMNAVYADILLYSGSVNTGTAYWDDVELKEESTSFWGVNMHERGLERVPKALDHIRNLGARHFRFDFVWKELEPSRDVWNSQEMDKMDKILDMATQRGLDAIAILGGSDNTPDWAKTLYMSDPDAFFEEWHEFCYGVSSYFKWKLYYYQMANEENHNFHEMVADGKEPQLFRACFSGLVAGEGSTAANHKEKFKTIVNVFIGYNVPFIIDPWIPALNSWLSDPQSGPAIDIAAIDHYPNTWDSDWYDHWSELDDLENIVIARGKECAIMETGYSTYGGSADEIAQNNYINTALEIIWIDADIHNSYHPNNKFLITVWYDLIDSNSNDGFPPHPENHFGILHSDWNGNDWSKKYGFTSLYNQMQNDPYGT